MVVVREVHDRLGRLALYEEALEEIAALAPQMSDEDFHREHPTVTAIGRALVALEDGGAMPAINPKSRRAAGRKCHHAE